MTSPTPKTERTFCPHEIEAPEGRFFLTEYGGKTTKYCKHGAGHDTREYWHETKGDVIRLHRLADGRWFID